MRASLCSASLCCGGERTQRLVRSACSALRAGGGEGAHARDARAACDAPLLGACACGNRSHYETAICLKTDPAKREEGLKNWVNRRVQAQSHLNFWQAMAPAPVQHARTQCHECRGVVRWGGGRAPPRPRAVATADQVGQGGRVERASMRHTHPHARTCTSCTTPGFERVFGPNRVVDHPTRFCVEAHRAQAVHVPCVHARHRRGGEHRNKQVLRSGQEPETHGERVLEPPRRSQHAARRAQPAEPGSERGAPNNNARAVAANASRGLSAHAMVQHRAAVKAPPSCANHSLSQTLHAPPAVAGQHKEQHSNHMHELATLQQPTNETLADQRSIQRLNGGGSTPNYRQLATHCTDLAKHHKKVSRVHRRSRCERLLKTRWAHSAHMPRQIRSGLTRTEAKQGAQNLQLSTKHTNQTGTA